MSRKKQFIAGIASILMVLQPLTVVAAPGTLSQDPLFIGTNVQPNIFFVLDDSGSMDWEVLKSNAADTLFPQATASVDFCSGSCEYFGNDRDGETVDEDFCRQELGDNGFVNVTEFPNSGNLDFTPNTQVSSSVDPDGPNNQFRCTVRHLNQGVAEMLELCEGYNVMAYDPNRIYTPWLGEDEGGNAYTDKTLTTALNDPYFTDGIRNLTSHFYMVWNDDGDGIYEAGECPTNFTAIDTGDNGSISQTECDADPNCVSVNGLSAEQQQNYANWYTYYRKREYVAKRAMSEVITQSTARVGLATIDDDNDANKNDGIEIRDVDNITTPVNATAQTNKDALLDTLFQINSAGNTPLRNALELAGNYFEQDVDTDLDILFGFTPTEFGGTGTLNQSPIFTDANGGSCQKNFTVLLSDGFWNGPAPAVGNTDGPGDGNTNFDGQSYADEFSNTLADVAMHFYERDLAPALNDDLTVSPVDPNSAQHMVTYTVAFGINGSLTADPPNTTDPFAWPQPQSGTRTTIDDMRHAAWNGRGQFLSAADPEELISSFDDALDDIQSRVSSAASVSFNSTSLDNGALLFRAEFNPAGWSGDIQALSVTSAGVGDSQWSAAAGLNSDSVNAGTREIITYNGTQGIAFDWPADHTSPTGSELSTAQINDLLADNADPTDAANYGSDILDYLRGDFSEEAQQVGNTRGFRNRLGERLGDIVHSAPVFVGTPNARYPDDIAGASNLYSTFIANNDTRRELIYVGANDGMLHAFDANTGAEVFAYIPEFLFSSSNQEGLHYLADQNYTHRSYVDLTPATGDVFVNGAWRTYLVGGARAGGKGVFVLDVTNPGTLASAESNADSIVVKEFTDPDLGFTYSQISIAKMNNGRWAAIFGNGYNNSGDGTAKIFILYLDSTGGHVELTTGVGDNDAGTAIENNGMSTPEVLDLDNNGTADRIYAGDVLGNMWAFDVSNANSANWGSAYGSSPLFVATDASGNAQPITSKPSVDVHPRRNLTASSPNLLVTFGSGQYLTDNDPGSTAQQTFYGVWDSGRAVSSVGSGSYDRDRLVTQTITQTTVDGTIVRQNSSNTVNYNLAAASPQMGWKIDLPTTGERNVVNPAILGPIVFFNTLIPESSQCAFGGSGFLMNVDLLTGGQPAFEVIDLPNNSGVYSGIESQGVPTAPTFVSNRGTDRDATRYVNTSRGIETGDISFGADSSGRTSWTNLTR